MGENAALNKWSWVWSVCLVLGLFAMAGYWLLPSDAETTRNIYYQVFGLSSVTAIVLGIRLNRLPSPLPWYLILAAVSMLVVADGIFNYYEVFLGIEAPFPSLADVVYLGAYVVLAVGLILLVRARTPGSDRGSLIDATIIATGAGVVCWVYLVEPRIDPSMSLLARSISVSYPLMDVLFLALFARLLFSPGARPLSFYLICVSLGSTLVSDVFYAIAVLSETYKLGSPVDYGWLLSYTLWGAATLHPSMRMLSEPGSGYQGELTAHRISLLAAASLLAPLVLAVEYIRGNSADVPVIVAGSAVLFLLPLLRMNGLVHKLASTLAKLEFNVGELKRSQKKVQASEAELKALLSAMSDVIFVLDSHGRYLKIAPSELSLLYKPSHKLIGKTLHEVFPQEQADAFVAAIQRALETRQPVHIEYSLQIGSKEVWFAAAISLMTDNSVVWVARDVTERRKLEERLKHQAFHDSLTNLPNRASLMNRLDLALHRTNRHGSWVAILFVDLDNFKVVNDSFGHQAGDSLLVAVAKRFRECLRPEDTLTRFGGDEFILLIEDIMRLDEAVSVAERLLEDLQEPFVVEGREIIVTASIGIALATDPDIQPQDLLRHANIAMYRVKEKRKSSYEVFDPSMDPPSLKRLELEQDLRRALERDELRLYYQPKVLLQTGRVVGMEALLRWEHPERGLLSPVEFIPLAEATGLIVPLGQWVLEKACRQAKVWQERYPSDSPLVMCVNVSGRQLWHSKLADDVSRVLKETQLEPETLDLEITEGVLVNDELSTIATLHKLKRLGVKLIIDDFGTGYSSLSYLKRLPVDYLKIDRSFIEGLGKDPKDGGIVSAAIDMTRVLGMEEIAEGVETAEQAAFLRKLECRFAQGYYFSKPLPAEAADALLATNAFCDKSTIATNRKR